MFDVTISIVAVFVFGFSLCIILASVTLYQIYHLKTETEFAITQRNRSNSVEAKTRESRT